MADISKIVTPDGSEYNLKDALKKGVYTVIGTQTAQTAAWTGNIDVPALYDGLTIAYYLPYKSKENASLNLTLSNGTKTGAVACYIGTSRISTHYSVGSTIILTYYGAGSVSVGGTPTSAARWSAGDYDSNSWRNIQVNGTELLGTATSSGALNLKSGTNVTVSGSGNDVTIDTTIPDADDIFYDNTTSGLTATDVQGAIDEIRQAMIDAIYPVGSIYMSVSSTNPGTTFGVGTWEAWGSGRVPVGVKTSDTAFDTVEKTGGGKTTSYTPAGTNSGCAVTKHTYTPAGTNSGCAVTAHTYTPAGTIGKTTLTAAQSGVHSHTHTITNTQANPSGTHTHGDYVIRTSAEASGYGLTATAGFKNRVLVHSESSSRPPANNGIATIADSGAHTHTINSTSKNASESHTHSWTGTKATLSHTVTQPTFTGTQASLTHTVTQPTFSGTAANISTVQPYITCYMWKRTA